MAAQAGNNSLRRAVVVGGNRIPLARSNKEYANESSQDMLTIAIGGLVTRFGIDGKHLGAVSAGVVLRHSRDFNLTRECVLSSALAPDIPALDIQMACATGMEALSSVSNMIELGQIDFAITGGIDTTSNAPIAVSDHLRKILLEVSHQKPTLDMAKVFPRTRPSNLIPDTSSTGGPRTGLSTGEHQAVTTTRWGVTRTEQDKLAAASRQNMVNAYNESFFTDLIAPYKDVSRDTNMRPDPTPEKLAKLKPVFGHGLGTEPTMTAGNSTPLTDDTSAVPVSTPEWAVECGLSVLANVVDSEAATVGFVHDDEGLLMTPTYVTPRLLARNGWAFDDFDFLEIHEAFTGTVLSTMKAWEDEEFCRTRFGLEGPLGSIPRKKLNVKDSSLAAGHPFTATGSHIVAALAKILRQKTNEIGETARGLISVCTTSDQGVVAVLEAHV